MRLIAPALAALALTTTPVLAEELDVAGLWLTQSGGGKVNISDCGDGTPCGTLTWVDPAEAGPGIDGNNPDPELQGRPLVGIQLVWGFERNGESWRRGNIYDPETGKTYRSTLRLNDDGTLRVQGCVGPICQSQIWTALEVDG
ncbi:DUF2147 domain-containing protein [Parvularcula sp. IMCC14364]|uniref:DUF2147 domain-containing protein n=1 Tax=Parvularcula sp. IMCC14364 TaxID=3067902 RepID=UPI00274059D2|nr:DUF2147 domain-containing protein [Parvularcula sp. IMCC14364]